MDLPETKMYRRSALEGDGGELTMRDFFVAKDKAMPTWSLYGLTKFMAVCRRATRVCQQSSHTAAAISAVALGELLDIALRVHREYELLGALGPNEVRFKARMYLHLQHASHNRVLYTGSNAMAAFERATDLMVTRLPASAFQPPRVVVRGSVRRQDPTAACMPVETKSPRGGPASGCWLCPAPDHYCNDKRFHVKVNGRYKKVSKSDKEAILDRIAGMASWSDEAKAEETRKVKDFWSQQSL